MDSSQLLKSDFSSLDLKNAHYLRYLNKITQKDWKIGGKSMTYWANTKEEKAGIAIMIYFFFFWWKEGLYPISISVIFTWQGKDQIFFLNIFFVFQIFNCFYIYSYVYTLFGTPLPHCSPFPPPLPYPSFQAEPILPLLFFNFVEEKT
jgi:hypothetical protein